MHEGRIFQKPIHYDETKSGIENEKSRNENRYDILNEYEPIECENNNDIVPFLSENILLAEKNNVLNLEVDNAIETCEIEKITNESLQILLAKVTIEIDKEKNQVKQKFEENTCNLNVSKIHLQNTIRCNNKEIEVINNACSDVTNVLLCRFYEDCSRMSKDFEEADQSLIQLCTMHSDLKERFKKTEKQWIQKVTELLEKCALLEKHYDGEHVKEK